ncbi:VOC family protein [Streptomyces sp. NPDC002932]|uniref:VOC family protein n=1 Tax=Streptomyces sp. NPDC002932 TaxID=3364672 RepID=UPI00367E7D65
MAWDGGGVRPRRGLLFEPGAEERTGKNHLHLGFRLDDRDAEVERFVALGARHADVGRYATGLQRRAV